MLLNTICGRARELAREDETGAQIKPLVCRTMKAILSLVTSSAAMIRSPSFSRDGESRTMMNCPSSVVLLLPSILKIPQSGFWAVGKGNPTECFNSLFDAVKV